MKKFQSVVKIIGLVVKWSAVVIAVVKGIEVTYNEIKKIDLNDLKIDSDDSK